MEFQEIANVNNVTTVEEISFIEVSIEPLKIHVMGKIVRF